MPVEEQILQAVRALAPDKQEAVLKFAESLRDIGRTEDVKISAKPSIDLADRGINAEQALELRSRLRTIAEDWNLPEMAAYDEL